MMMANPNQKLHVRLIASKIDRILDAAAIQPQDVPSVEAGVSSECAHCDSPSMVCMRHPGYLCRRPFKAGTLLQEYESALRRVYAGSFCTCVVCGGVIDRSSLRKNPDTCICGFCRT